MGQVDDEKSLPKITHLLQGVEASQLALVSDGLEVDKAPEIKKVRGAHQCHWTAERASIG